MPAQTKRRGASWNGYRVGSEIHFQKSGHPITGVVTEVCSKFVAPYVLRAQVGSERYSRLIRADEVCGEASRG